MAAAASDGMAAASDGVSAKFEELFAKYMRGGLICPDESTDWKTDAPFFAITFPKDQSAGMKRSMLISLSPKLLRFVPNYRHESPDEFGCRVVKNRGLHIYSLKFNGSGELEDLDLGSKSLIDFIKDKLETAFCKMPTEDVSDTPLPQNSTVFHGAEAEGSSSKKNSGPSHP